MNNDERNLGFFARMCLFLSRHRIAVLLNVLIVTGVFFYGAFKIKGEVIIQEMFPYDHPYLKIMGSFSDAFGTGGSGLVIVVNAKEGDIFSEKTLGKIKAITEDVEIWDETYRVLTVSLASNSIKVAKNLAKGEIRIESLMYPYIPKTGQEMEELKKNIFSNPSYNGVLVSEDGTAALISTEVKENIQYLDIFKKLDGLIEKYSDDETSIHIVGFPMLMGWIYSLKPQMYKVFAISIAAIALMLFLIYRNIQGMMAPLANAGILTILGLGFIGFIGINFNPLLYVLAFLVGARMIGNSNQITYRYFEELNACGGDRVQACYKTMLSMWIPNCAAVATDAAGFLVLLVAKIVLMQHLAVIMSFWMISIVLTGLIVPVVCSIIPLDVVSEKWGKESSQVGKIALFVMKITQFSIAPRGRYVVGGAVIALAVFCLFQVSQLKIGDPTPGSPIFYQWHAYNKDQALLNEKFKASSENLVLFYEGTEKSAYDAEVLNTFEKFSLYMAKELPDIYKTSSSIVGIAKTLNKTQHEGDPMWHQLPRTNEMLTGLMGYVMNTVGVYNLRKFVDISEGRAQTVVLFSDHTSDNLLRIRDAAYAFFEKESMKTPNGEFKLAGGRIGMEIAVNEEMKRTHVIIDLMVLCAIFALCTLSYRSIVAALMLTLPLILANSVAGAYMALKGIGLSINTLPIAAIGVGVGVDFAIYLYSRCKEEFPLQNGEWDATIIQSVCTCGKAVVYTGLTIILPILTWYFFSDMKFQADVGFFLSMIMGTNVILTLTLHPLMIYVIKPKFISKTMAIDPNAVKDEKLQCQCINC